MLVPGAFVTFNTIVFTTKQQGWAFALFENEQITFFLNIKEQKSNSLLVSIFFSNERKSEYLTLPAADNSLTLS